MMDQAAVLIVAAAWLAGTPKPRYQPAQKSDFHAVMKIHRKRRSRKRRK